MKVLNKIIKIIINMFIAVVLLMFIAIFIMLCPLQNTSNNTTDSKTNINSFQLNQDSITYDKSNIISNASDTPLTRQNVLDRARAMVGVKWSPKYNIIDKYGLFIFIKGKTYYGIPYSMNFYQVSSVNDFLSKISNSKILYGNDCSGFVSSAWGLSRQTTLTLFNAVKNGSKIDGKTVSKISWKDLKPGDALLYDNGKGHGHIVLYINTDSKNSDKMNVYEQNIETLIPFEPLPLARKDIRYKSTLIKQGYFPIRLMSLGS
jgi:cell wall-associated NlpC family hydrolase